MIVIVIMCFVLPLAVIIHDRMMYRRWYARRPKMVFLRMNTKEVRDLLAKEGFEICWCCLAKGNIYLTAGSEGTIHGMGNPCDGDSNLSAKEVLAMHINEARQLNQLIIDCGTDVGKFIKEVKLIRKNKL